MSAILASLGTWLPCQSLTNSIGRYGFSVDLPPSGRMRASPQDFAIGGTVQAKNGLYITRAADEQLLKLCRDGEFAYLLTARQLGKSSLMVRTAQRLTEEGARCAQIDLTQIGAQVSAEQWYLGLITFIVDQLRLRTDAIAWWQARAHLGNATRLSMFLQDVVLQEVREHVVIFVDEIDSTLSLNFTDDFFAAIRSFYNARAQSPQFKRLSFVLIGVATPTDLIQDRHRTPFNIGHRVELTDFTLDEAVPLAALLGLNDNDTREVLKRVLAWTGGHPYLTQRVLRQLAQHRATALNAAALEQIISQTFLGEKSETDNNLQFVRDMLTKRLPERQRYEVLSTYRDVWSRHRRVSDEEQSVVKNHLKLAGIVCRRNGNLEVRNAIYRRVFDRPWVQSQMRVDWKKRLKWAQAIAVSLLVALISVYAVKQHQVAREKERAMIATMELNRKLELAREVAEEEKRYAESQTALAQRKHQEAVAERQRAQELASAERAAKKRIQRLAAAKLRAQQETAKQALLAKRNEEQARQERERANTAQKNAQDLEDILRRSGALMKKTQR